MCSWRQSKEDDFDWLIKAGSTPTVGTGPSNDHTVRDPSGHYLYLEGSFPQAAGDTARISGPVLSRRSLKCTVSRPFILQGNSCNAKYQKAQSVFRQSSPSKIQSNFMIAASLVNIRRKLFIFNSSTHHLMSMHFKMKMLASN